MMFIVTKADIQKAFESCFQSEKPLVMSLFPTKEKRKYLTLFTIIREFDPEKTYTEKEVNAILRPIYPDHVTIRRYLVDYQFLGRRADGSSYWVKTDGSNPIMEE